MSFSAGEKLAQYEITALLGQGGMGEVYRARDTELKREVALKVLSSIFAADADRVARFQREAQVLASLNHSNIAHLYGFAEADGTRALIMELVEGESPQGPMPFEEAWKIMSQVADGLEYAHERGIVHRDLKPANLKVTPDGRVKILDFGLAKALAGNAATAASTSAGDSPTITVGATRAGVILGTAAYMAPEQIKGKDADRRADIWAFGVVLYELLTGERPFKGSDITELMAHAVTSEPVLDKAPARVKRLLTECLQKQPGDRLGWIGDAGKLLDEPGQAPTATITSVAPARPRLFFGALATSGVLAVALGAISWSHFREVLPSAPAGRFDVALRGDNLGNGAPTSFALSPDGRNLAYSGVDGSTRRLFVRPLDSLESRVIPGTDEATYPFWSPDGENLGFFAQGRLKRVALAGGPSQTLANASTPRGGTWNRDGIIVFAPNINGGLYRVSEQGGDSKQVTFPDVQSDGSGNISQRYPEFIFGSSKFLFEYTNGRADGIYVGSLDGKAPVRILADGSRGLYVLPSAGTGSGNILFRRESTLMALPFDAEKLRAAGPVIPVAENVADAANTTFGAFTASQNGVLLYRTGTAQPTRKLVWLDRSGTTTDVSSAPEALGDPALSPDGKRAAFVIAGTPGNSDIWIRDLEHGLQTRFTFGPGTTRDPIWSADGNDVMYVKASGGANLDFYRKSADGSGKEELLLHTGFNGYPSGSSPDGKMLVYSQTGAETKNDLWLLPLTGDRKPIKYLDSP